MMLLTAAEPAAPGPEPAGSVRVWFGEHLLLDWVGPAEDAPKIAAGVKRRFAGLRVDKAPGTDW